MKVIKNESIVCFDVDDTLILHKDPKNGTVSLVVPNPYAEDHPYEVWVHTNHVRFIKEQKARGRCVIVWSAAGYRWAETIIGLLDLEEYVDYVITKPVMCVDDLEPSEYLPKSVYLPVAE
jgi:predicted phosphatase